MKRWICLTLFAWLAASLPGFAIGLIVVPPQENWRPQPVPDQPQIYPFAPLEMTYAHVDVRITDQVATTKVDQEFYNPGPERLEGTFLFPLPAGAHVDKFTMQIDGLPANAELLAADKATGIYEDIVRRMRDPALLEYCGRDVLKLRIYPIDPGAHKRITLTYTELLPSDSGLVNYTLPLNAGKFSAAPIQNVSVTVHLKTSRPLKTVYSPSHDVEIKRNGADRADIGYEAENVRPDADFQLCFSAQKDELGVNLLTSRGADGDGYFLLLASPGIDQEEKQVEPKDVVFVLDTSGSMSGPKIEQAKKALQFCVNNLNDSDRFELVRFSTDTEPLFGELTTATAENRAKAADFVQNLEADGGTAIDDALKNALALRPKDNARPFVVIFLTDGMPTVGVTDEDTILADVRQAAGATRIFCFGLGTDVNTHLLDSITGATRGFSQYVLPEEDIEVKVSSFFSKIKEPVLANPVLRFTGGIHATKVYPAPLPDLFKGEQVVVSGRYSGDGPATVVIEGTVNGAPKQFSFDVNFPREARGKEFVARLWATRRVGFLLDQIRLHGENPELKEEVTRLARKFAIVTPYTAYLIVEDETQRAVPVAVQSLPQFYNDREAETLTKATYDSLNGVQDGLAGVANARYGLAMQQAVAPAAAQASGRIEGLRSLDAGANAALPPESDVSAVSSRVDQYTQQQKFVSNRGFFQNGNTWIDSEVQNQQAAKHVRLQFSSPEYFAFAENNAAARPWLALGRNVQFVFNGTVYEIYE